MILFVKSSVADGLLLFVASMAFHGHPSIAVQPPDVIGTPEKCYQCVAFEGISNPVCEFPVARKAPIVPCGTAMNAEVRSTCGKLVVFSKGHRAGQTLKSWLMKRECLYDTKIKTRYDNLALKCNTCGEVQNSVKIFQRLAIRSSGGYPRAMLPDEQDQLIVLMCVCCEPLCNAEEGFNLSHFQDDRNSGILLSRNNEYGLMVLFSLHCTYFLLNKNILRA